MINKLYTYRFELFFYSQIIILFGSLVIPSVLFENVVSPMLFQINILAGILLLFKKKKVMWFLIFLLIITTLIISSNIVTHEKYGVLNFFKMCAYFLFYVIVTFQLIMQVWKSKEVGKNVIFGLISGYVSLGLIGFFITLTIEMITPGSFSGLIEGVSITENLMYYSYITLLTIGYGDMLPVTPLAQKSAILIGLTGQMYLVIITAIVIGKYISQSSNK